MRRLLHQENYIGEILEVRVTSLLPALPEAGAWLTDPKTVAQSIYQGRRISMPPEPKMDSWGRPL